MNKESYILLQTSPVLYTFVSTGKVGNITKAVLFQQIEPNLYNLVLADKNEESDSWIDDAATNNGDMSKVMATVAKIIITFINFHPTSQIYIEANSKSRNLLYHRILKNYLSEFESNIKVEGFSDEKVEKFDPTKLYDSYLISKKIIQ